MTAATITAEERDILTLYAQGWEIADIATDRSLRRDRVQGVLARKAALNRDRARQLLEVEEAPEPALAEPPVPPAEHVAAPREPEPEPRGPDPNGAPADRTPLDDGIDAIALRLRALVASLVDAAVEQEMTRIRGRLEQVLREEHGGGHGP